MDGSSATGHCHPVSETADGLSTCGNPMSSVLFDGEIPTLTGLDGNMWASQLFTLQPAGGTINITFNSEIFSPQRVEVVLFNCPQRGISVQDISLHNQQGPLGSTNSIVSSCDSLVTVCFIRVTTALISNFSVRFTIQDASSWVYLAELRFFSDGSTCTKGCTTGK